MLQRHIPFRAKYIAKELSRLSVGKLTNLVLPEATRFVILTNGRTGSNLLVSYLKQNPNIRLYGEILGKYYLDQPFVRTMIRERGAVPYFRNMQSRILTESHVGAKLLYAHVEPPYAKRRELPDLPRVLDSLAADMGTKIIHLRRENLLDVVISGKLAKQTMSYVGRDYGDIKIELKPRICRRLFEKMQAQEARYRALFAGHDYLEVTYEQVVDNPEKMIAATFAFLGVEPVPAKTSLEKQNRAPRESVVSNYAELKREFSDTEYAAFFV